MSTPAPDGKNWKNERNAKDGKHTSYFFPSLPALMDLLYGSRNR